MKIKIKELGPIRQAEFELGEMTIICGGNNTGKTYTMYALYGFFRFWQEAYSIPVPAKSLGEMFENGKVRIDLQDYIKRRNKILKDACKKFRKQLPVVLAASKKHFSNTEFLIELDESKECPVGDFKQSFGTSKKQLFQIQKVAPCALEVNLLVEAGSAEIDQAAVSEVIGNAVQKVLFGQHFPAIFESCAERSGAAIFRTELDFARNRLLEQMSAMDREINPFELLHKAYTAYAMPVRDSVDFIRRLQAVAQKESFISKDHPDILDDFATIIGGEYKVLKTGQIYFISASNKRIRLDISESSSVVRSMLDMGFYLRHEAEPGSLLLVDEPELNMHPENQRRIARLFVRLINIGIKVFISTHSDYIIKELNTLIMLNQDKKYLKQIIKEEGYHRDELLRPEQVKVYIAEKAPILIPGNTRKRSYPTLVAADIDPELGIEVRSFDTTIDDMNRIQEAIVWGGDE
jgi:AAA15 family ATPase/GTPase